MRNLIILGFLGLSSSMSLGFCPEADLGYQGGCLIVEENHKTPNGNQLQIFYQWKEERSEEKETIVFLNGGPGGSLMAYRSMIDANLIDLKDYNILLYDARGIGRSSHVMPDHQGLDLSLYTTNDHVEDLSQLISRVVGDDAIIFGHSYGGMLGYAFATLYPEKVSKLISLNASTDGMGMIMQTQKKQEAFERALASLDEDRMNAFLAFISQGLMLDENGHVIQLQNLLMDLLGLVSTFHGQNEGVKERVESLMAINEKLIDQAINGSATGVNDLAIADLRDDNAPMEMINMTVNMYMVCHELINPAVLEQGSYDDVYITSSQMFFEQACAGVFDQNQVDVYNTKYDLSYLSMPILIMGGTHDPLVPLEAQERDFKLLSDMNKTVSFVTLGDTGHQIFFESDSCFRFYLNRFLEIGHIGFYDHLVCQR